MTVKKIVWITALIIIIVITFLLTLFFEPLFLRRRYIERITTLEIPRTASIIEYQFGITSFGIQPFFAKLELSQEEYSTLRRYFIVSEEYLEEFHHMTQTFNYTSVSLDDIAEIGWIDRMTRRMSIFLEGTSWWIQSIIITTDEGEHFLYVFFR